MAEYQNTIITNAGISVLNRVLASKATMTFTRAVSSTADLSGKTEADLRNMTSLSNIMQNGICSSYDIHNQNMVSLDLVFTNEGLGNSYLINTVGLYAKASDSSSEVLYAIARAGVDSNGNSLAEQMPAYVDSKLTKFTISLFTQVGQSSSVSVSITNEGVVKSINGSLKPDANGDVTIDDSSHAKFIEAELIHGHLLVPLVDDSGNPITDEAGNQLIADENLPKTDGNINIDDYYSKQEINNLIDSLKLDASKAGAPIVITTPVDLNTLTTCGSYFILNGNNTNTPIPNASLYVRVEGVPSLQLTQTLWNAIYPAQQWIRLCSMGKWWGWDQITKKL